MILFRTAAVEVTSDKITAEFNDGKRNTFHLSAMEGDKEYRRIAKWAGYGDDWRQYGTHHELTHHWLADHLGWRYSWSLYENRHQPWPDHIAWEEHLVNALARYLKTGIRDEHGVLKAVFGTRLPEATESLRRALARVQ